jgi:hypothetical protein
MEDGVELIVSGMRSHPMKIKRCSILILIQRKAFMSIRCVTGSLGHGSCSIDRHLSVTNIDGTPMALYLLCQSAR